MAWTYSNNPGTGSAATRRDAVRLTIGDTDTTDQQVSDEEVAFWLLGAGDDYIGASIEAARALAAKYTRQADTTHGKLSISASQRAKAYLALVDQLQSDRDVQGGAEFFVGGLTISGKEALASDPDAIQPGFAIGMDDYDDPNSSRWGPDGT
jgi:hypothetical protein